MEGVVSRLLEPKFYEFDEIDLVPNKPGFYSWYLSHVVQEPDKNPDGIAGVFEKVLHKSRRPNLFLDGTLGSDGSIEKWRGELKHEKPKSPWIDGQGNIAEVVRNFPGDVAGIFNNLQDRIQAPIYLGISMDLRTRLTQHREIVKTLKEKASEYEDAQFDQEASSFGQRVVAAEIRTVDLSVAVHVVEFNEEIDTTSQKKILEIVEYVLNRKVSPLHGRK